MRRQRREQIMQEWMTIRQAAELLGIHRQTVYQAIRAGRLPSEEQLDRVVVKRSDVEAYRERTAGIGPEGGRPKAPRRPVGRPRKQATV
jgi:excisionase family DNA binding protein